MLLPSTSDLAAIATELRALSSPTRLQILIAIEAKGRVHSVGAVSNLVGISPALASLHLQRSNELGLTASPEQFVFELTTKGKRWLNVVRSFSDFE